MEGIRASGGRLLVINESRQGPYGGILKEFQNRNIDLQRLAQAVLDLYDLQRMAAEIEEVVVHTELLDS
jgi:t-SNARE complex subunit (syntaxin)